MPECACGCKQEISGKARKWFNDDHKNEFNTRARRLAAGKIDALLSQAVSSDATPVPILDKKPRKGHAPTMESPALQKTLEILKSGPRTTWEIQAHTGSMAVSTDISALRKNGFTVSCQYKGVFNGRKVYEYSLI